MSKKVIISILVLMCLMFGAMVVNAEVSLQQVVDSFNNCETVNSYKGYDYNYNAEAKVDKLIVTIKAPEVDAKVEYDYGNGILHGVFSSDDALNGLITTTILVDAVGQVHGYKDGELFLTLNSDQILGYTVDNEGFEIKEKENGEYDVKIDINKKIPLADFSETFIEVADIDEFVVDLVHSDEPGSFYASKGPLVYQIQKYDNIVIYLAERDGLTQRAYNSMLSFVNVIFDSEKAVDYFKSNYSNLAEGNKTFDGFDISLNVIEEDMPEFGDEYSVLKLVIDKQSAEDKIANYSETQKTSNEVSSNNEQNNSKILIYIIAGIAVAAIVVIVVVMSMKKR